MNNVHVFRITSPLFYFIFFVFLSHSATANIAVDSSCQLNYPIVLSHFWGVEKICSDTPSEECDRLQPKKYCADWQPNNNGDALTCVKWRIPENELDLPPRNVNAYDSNLTRDLSEYHRYFSKDIIEKLQDDCGNSVFISDKPIYASYEVRAKSLRNTVLHALEETGADKVNLIGMSQGSQDARYLTARLPVSDSDPSQGMMKDKIAGVVTVVGEDQGAASSTLFLSIVYLTNVLGGAGWGDFSNDLFWPPTYLDMLTGVWAIDRATPEEKYVLIEGYDENNAEEFNLDQNQFYRTFLHSLANLSQKYMQGSRDQEQSWEKAWDALHQYLNTDNKFWSDEISEDAERENGVEYFSYAAQVQSWNASDWGLTSQAALSYYYIKATEGANDSYVSVKSQRLDNRDYDNFQHVKTIKGSPYGRGYFHSYFTGRNDKIYSPPLRFLREPAPFNGSSADFYKQVAVYLKPLGF